MSRHDILKTCIEIAEKAHEGQTRNDGVTPYIEHPTELMGLFHDPIDRCIAVLHDAVEDGEENGVDLKYIRDTLSEKHPLQIFDEIARIVFGVYKLTHCENDTYKEYISRIPEHLRKFKIMDITINLADAPSDYQKKKYKKAMRILLRTECPLDRLHIY